MLKLKKAYRNLDLKKKLIVSTSSFIVCCVLATSTYLYQLAEQNQTQLTYSQLKSSRESKSRQIENYFQRVRSQVVTLSDNLMTIEAMEAFSLAFNDLKKGELKAPDTTNHQDALYRYYKEEYQTRVRGLDSAEDLIPGGKVGQYLQYHYIADNQYPTKSKEKLDFADDGSSYSQTHKKYHGRFRDYLSAFGYYDIFLVDAQSGDIVYSVYKEIDYASNLINGPYKDSNIGRLFREARLASEPGFVKLVDYKPYRPSYGDVASFIASPIFDQGRNIGVLIFQMPIVEINAIMTGSENWYLDGLGKTGETVIIGSDGRLRSQSRFVIEGGKTFLKQLQLDPALGFDAANERYDSENLMMLPVDIKQMVIADNFIKGEKLLIDYRHEQVFAAFTPLAIADVNWQFLTKIDSKEAHAFLQQLINKNALYCLIFALLLVPFIYLFAISISIPLNNLSILSQSMSGEPLTDGFHYASNNVIGQLSVHINDNIRLLADQKDQIKQLTNDNAAAKQRLERRIDTVVRQQIQQQQSSSALLSEGLSIESTLPTLQSHHRFLKRSITNLGCSIELMRPMEASLYEITTQLTRLSTDQSLWQADEIDATVLKKQHYLKEIFEQLTQLSTIVSSDCLKLNEMMNLDYRQCETKAEQVQALQAALQQQLTVYNERVAAHQAGCENNRIIVAELHAQLKSS
ncbi:MAG: cache domain-containing protein [Algicola sp.]|nr:cache domain-containing protein [Algicola sp.]